MQNIEIEHQDLLEIFEVEKFEKLKRILDKYELVDGSKLMIYLENIIHEHLPKVIKTKNYTKLSSIIRFFNQLRIHFSPDKFDKLFKFVKIPNSFLNNLKSINPDNSNELLNLLSEFFYSGDLVDIQHLTKILLGSILNEQDDSKKELLLNFLILVFSRFRNFFRIEPISEVYQKILKMKKNSLIFTKLICNMQQNINWNFIFDDQDVCNSIEPFDENLTFLAQQEKFVVPKKLEIRLDFLKLISSNIANFNNWFNLISTKFKKTHSNCDINSININGFEFPKFKDFMFNLSELIIKKQNYDKFCIFEVLTKVYLTHEYQMNVEHFLKDSFLFFYEIKLKNPTIEYILNINWTNISLGYLMNIFKLFSVVH